VLRTLLVWSKLVLAVGVLVEVVRRFVFGSEPESLVMIAIAYSLILGGAMGNLMTGSFAAMLWIPLISIGETGIGRPSTWLILQLSSVPYFSFSSSLLGKKGKHQCRAGWI